MRTLSARWLHEPTVRAVLEREPKTASLLPDLDEAHRGLCDTLGGEDASPMESQLKALRERGATIDARHDRKYRGTWKYLDALIELCDDEDAAEELKALRDRLHPNGLPQVNAAWVDEAGNASTVRLALDKATRAQLKKFTGAEGRTLEDEVLAWVKAGEELGPVVAEKAAVEQQLASPVAPTTGATQREAKAAWARVVTALESNLELVKGLSTEDHARVMGLLHQTAEATERRTSSRRRGEKPAEPTPPTK